MTVELKANCTTVSERVMPGVVPGIQVFGSRPQQDVDGRASPAMTMSQRILLKRHDMKITNVRAHHIRIPYDAGVASFRQGASAITALDMVLVEVSTDAGLTGWGDAFAYVCPRTTRTAVEEMIAPQATGQEVPEAAGIPVFMEQIQRNLHLFGRYGITMFAISALDIALWDLAAKVKGVPLHRLIGDAKRTRVPGLCQPAADRHARTGRERVPDGAAAWIWRDQAA